jgi:hypothetical protein
VVKLVRAGVVEVVDPVDAVEPPLLLPPPPPPQAVKTKASPIAPIAPNLLIPNDLLITNDAPTVNR